MSTGKIVCVGLNPALDRVLAIPSFHVGGVHQATVRAFQPAGKATNVARVLGALGVPCVLAGMVGRGEATLFTESFAGSPVDVCLTPVSGATRINTTILDPEGGDDTHIREEGFFVSDEVFASCAVALEAMADAGDWCVFSGSLPRGVGVDAVCGLMRRLAERGVRVAVDTSGPLLVGLRNVPLALLKMNREESETFFDENAPADDVSLLASWIMEKMASGCVANMVCVTDGPHGGGIFDADGGLWGDVPSVSVVSTVGAGDAMLAGFLARDDAPRARQLAWALACGSAATQATVAGEVDEQTVVHFESNIFPTIHDASISA